MEPGSTPEEPEALSEEQLEQLLDDLNANLRPKLEKPVRERPLLAVGIAAGIGLLAGLLLSGGRRR